MSMTVSIPASRRAPSQVLAGVRSAVGPLTPRRRFQLALGFIWLVDAALQYQPYMFTKAFVTNTVAPTAAGNPGVVAQPITWAASIMVHHIALYNALFATIQLAIGLGLLWRPTVKLALAASLPWAFGVWWLAEGLGGVLAGPSSPFSGAPGAVILYAFIALLVWPRAADDAPRGPTTGVARLSVGTSGILGSTVPRVLALSLWGSFVYSMLQPANRAADSLGSLVSGMAAGEPGWLAGLDRSLAHVLSGNGTWLALVFVGLFAFAGVGLFVPRLTRAAVLVGIAVGLVIWTLEDFGAILTGQGTDVNSGLLVALLAATFWPVVAVSPSGSGDVHDGAAHRAPRGLANESLR